MGVANRITQEEQIKICDLFINNNMTPVQIGKEVNRDPSTIRRILKNNNLEYNNINYVSKEELNNIINDYLLGMCPKDLSSKYKRNSGTIICLLRKANVYKNVNTHISKKDWEFIAELYKEGLNDEILDLFPELTTQALCSKMSKMKVKSGLRNYWSEKDKNIVKQFYQSKGTDYVYEIINHRHSKEAIEALAVKTFGYYKGYYWTKEEDELLIECYSKLSVDELLKLFPKRSGDALKTRAKILGLVSNYVLTTYWTEEENIFLINNWKNMSDKQISQYINRNPMSIKDRRNLLGLYRINKEFLGYESIKKLLRARTWVWKQESMQKCNYQCVLTGDKNFHIHHLYGFSDIFNSFIKLKGITEIQITNYTFEELENMCNEFVKYHSTYPLGVCVRKDLHVLFHELYNKHNNTPEQWDEFVNLYKNNKL